MPRLSLSRPQPFSFPMPAISNSTIVSGVVWCGVVWCDVVWCDVVWCGVAMVVVSDVGRKSYRGVFCS